MKKNKLIVITGGAKGIGLAIAQKLIAVPVTVIITSRQFDFTPQTLKINAVNQQFLDVNIPQTIQNFFTWLEQQDFELIGLINNAGIGIFKPFTDISLDEWNSVITTNLSGAFYCSQLAFKIMAKFNGGRILNIGSIVELAGIKHNAAYAASKAGLKALSLVISDEGKNSNISSTHIALGAVYTDIWLERNQFKQEEMLNIEDVANTICYLVNLSPSVRVDYIEITPPKKIL
ncbi:MAG: SDR family NAD(P)-dependent oxidoreductase [Burkholderiales bacterium]|nr:SDR family NAD(P)-dependent oxidoreductase [Burkholderiales bacterium]